MPTGWFLKSRCVPVLLVPRDGCERCEEIWNHRALIPLTDPVYNLNSYVWDTYMNWECGQQRHAGFLGDEDFFSGVAVDNQRQARQDVVDEDEPIMGGEEMRGGTGEYLSLLMWEHEQMAAVKMEGELPAMPPQGGQGGNSSTGPCRSNLEDLAKWDDLIV
jgi:hypothetical protein